MSKMTKKKPKAKIPRNLSDKDMVRDFVDEADIEEKIAQVEKSAKMRRTQAAKKEPPIDLAMAGLTPEITEKLGKELLKLKMELFREGVKDYAVKVKRDGMNIILTAEAR